ncbi:MAG: putative CoA-binding protein [Polaribacter sp.]|jgi:predicted CoA-binding protein
MTDSDFLRRVLREYKTVAMVGLSSNESRPSNIVAKYLLDRGFTIIPVNPKNEEILGLKCYPNLESIPVTVDIVDLFRRSDGVEPFVDSAIQIGAKLVWMQLGVVNEKAAQKAQNAGLEVVMNLCPKIEYARLFGERNTEMN